MQFSQNLCYTVSCFAILITCTQANGTGQDYNGWIKSNIIASHFATGDAYV